MTIDEIERVMNFIIERQERAAEHLDRGAKQLEQTETIMTALTQSQLQTNEELAAHNERIARFERSYSVIADLLGAA